MVSRSVLGAALVLAAWGVAAATASGDDEEFRFLKGTRWTYAGATNGKPTTVEQEVVDVVRGDLFRPGEPATVYRLFQKTRMAGPAGDEEAWTTTSYLGLAGGYFVAGTVPGTPVRIYKLGARRGDAWTCTDPRLKDVPGLAFTHLGIETVAVPAGVFRNARRLQVRVDAEGGVYRADFWVVPGVGIVKTEVDSDGPRARTRVVLELRRFAPAGVF